MTRIIKFSVARFERSIKLIAKIVASVIALVLIAILLGGQDAFGGKTNFIRGDFSGLFLFPGVAYLCAVDIPYFILIGLALFFAIVQGLQWYSDSCWEFRRNCIEEPCCRFDEILKSRVPDAFQWLWARPYLVLYVFPIAFALSHFFANLHWQFYCLVGVIPEHNCFWVFDHRSLLVGPAGMIGAGLGLCILLLGWLGCRLLLMTARWCCCCEIVEAEEEKTATTTTTAAKEVTAKEMTPIV